MPIGVFSCERDKNGGFIGKKAKASLTSGGNGVLCNGAFDLLHILLTIGLTTLKKGKLFDILLLFIYLFVYLFILLFRP